MRRKKCKVGVGRWSLDAGLWGVGLVGFILRDELGRNIHSEERKIEADIGDRKL